MVPVRSRALSSNSPASWDMRPSSDAMVPVIEFRDKPKSMRRPVRAPSSVGIVPCSEFEFKRSKPCSRGCSFPS